MAAILVGLTAHAMAAAKLALVVGNADYRNVGTLRNPANDADLVSRSLKATGFDVTDKRNLGSTEFLTAVIEFLKKVDKSGPGTVSLFYYAGHGTQVGSENYLIPVDAAADSSITLEAFGLSYYLDRIPSRIAASIIILDACRNNPFTPERGGGRGLTMVSDTGAVPTLIMFATGPGKTAADGEGANSPFSKALADSLVVPGITVLDMGLRVSAAVFEATNHEQSPWTNHSLKKDIVLATGLPPEAAPAAATPPAETASGQPAPEAPAAPAPAAPTVETMELAYLDALRKNSFEAYQSLLENYPSHPRREEVVAAMRRLTDEEFWKQAAAEGSLGKYQQYAETFPTGIYIEVARQKIRELAEGTDEVFCRSDARFNDARLRGRDALVGFRDRCAAISGGLAYRATAEIDVIDRQNKEFDSYRGIDFDGDDLGPWIENQSLTSCTDACRADALCRAFTFNTRRSICILKRGYGTPTYAYDAISAAVRGTTVPNPTSSLQMQSGMDYPGGDLDDHGYRPVTLGQCSDMCKTSSECRGFTYVRAKQWCWLKGVMLTGKKRAGYTSGVKLGSD
jgi:hypothetical protein